MIEGVELLVRPLMMLARIILWLCWELCVEIICWSIGWVVCRVITFGKFPNARITEIESVDWTKALVIELVGLVAIALLIYALAGLI